MPSKCLAIILRDRLLIQATKSVAPTYTCHAPDYNVQGNSAYMMSSIADQQGCEHISLRELQKFPVARQNSEGMAHCGLQELDTQ